MVRKRRFGRWIWTSTLRSEVVGCILVHGHWISFEGRESRPRVFGWNVAVRQTLRGQVMTLLQIVTGLYHHTALDYLTSG